MSSLIDFEDCLKAGLLKKGVPSLEQSKAALAKAKESLGDAKFVFQGKRHNATAMMAYLAMFNAARALLFKDGYREKSHACVARYVEAKYSGSFSVQQIEMLDIYREKRHDTQYSAVFNITEDDAAGMLKFAEEFIEKVEKIIMV